MVLLNPKSLNNQAHAIKKNIYLKNVFLVRTAAAAAAEVAASVVAH
jgi:hypothetical protein